MKKIFVLMMLLVIGLAACVEQVNTVIPSPTTDSDLPSQMPDVSTDLPPTPLVPTLTPVSSSSTSIRQSYPFPTETPNPTAQVIRDKWNADSVLLSPDAERAAISNPGILKVVQVQGNILWTVRCESFVVCEFLAPIQWSPDGKTLYFAPLITGEIPIVFPLYTGIARLDTISGDVKKIGEVDDGDEAGFSFALSPSGDYLAYTDYRNSPTTLIVLEATTLQEISKYDLTEFSPVDTALISGDILWLQDSSGFFFIMQDLSCASSLNFFDLRTRNVISILKNDPTCIKLISITVDNRIFLHKVTYYPYSSSYWFLDFASGQFSAVPSSMP